MVTYYGFLDGIEHEQSSRGIVYSLQFDSITESEATQWAFSDEGPTDWASWVELREAQYPLHPVFFVVTVPGPERDSIPGVRWSQLREGRWYRLEITRRNGPFSAQRFPDILGDAEAEDRVESIEPLDARTGPGRLLIQTFSLGEPDSDSVTITNRLVVKQSSYVAAFHVGQGSCAGLCSKRGVQIYFDLGGGTLRNTRTFPSGTTLCTALTPPVILSHWDKDHWSSGQRLPNPTQLTWVVPRQRFGPTHHKFATVLAAAGRILVWPRGLPSLSLGFGTLHYLGGGSSGKRNDTGLVLQVTVGKDHALLPGDAGYGHIPKLPQTSSGLLATHHGGKWSKGRPILAPSVHRITYSYGLNNYEHHPLLPRVKRHEKQGWLTRYDTPGGGVSLLGPTTPNCGCGACTLGTLWP